MSEDDQEAHSEMRRRKRDQRSNAELLAEARHHSKGALRRRWSSKAYRVLSRVACELHNRGTRDIFRAAVELTTDRAGHRRSLGCHLLGELRSGLSRRGPFFEERCDMLLRAPRSEPKAQVRGYILNSLGHLGNRRSDPEVMRHARDPDEWVRHQVAFALAGTMLPEAVPTLLVLMEDPASSAARDWATVAIGQELAFDGPNVREALLRRLADDDPSVRSEALGGLLRRGDPRVPLDLKAELERAGFSFEDALQERAENVSRVRP
jgi:HEAT repeat protein